MGNKLENEMMFKIESSAMRVPTLEKYGRNLTLSAMAGQFFPVYGREKEINFLHNMSYRLTKPNTILVGEAGCGKTAIVEEYAKFCLERAKEKGTLDFPIIYELSTNSLISGTRYRGDFEERTAEIIKEIKENKDIVLFIDEIHTVMGCGGAEGAIDFSQSLKPALARGEIRLIGATTDYECKQYLEKDKAFMRRFNKLNVSQIASPLQADIASSILANYCDKFEISADVNMEEVMNKIHYILPQTTFPDNIINYIDTALAIAKATDKTSITTRDIYDTMQDFHNIVII